MTTAERGRHIKAFAGLIIIVLLITTIYFFYMGTLDFFGRKPTYVQDYGIGIVSLMLLFVSVKVRDKL
ncbi:MAG: hypothetical protein HYY37_02910 [Candidatus Aenigmarchaeota archaeon]|nr:hypothetical protein [Candidatus Aenigmarchaeota archaeon]